LRYGDVVYGTPTRRGTIQVDGTPRALAFDAAGNLLVSLREPAGVAICAAASRGGAAPAPRAMLRGATTGLTRPSGLAFDATGNLWITQEDGAGALRYDGAFVSAMTGEVSAPPAFRFAPPADGVFHGIAFANAGAGWLSAEVAGRTALSHVLDMASPTPSVAGSVTLDGDRGAAMGLGMPAFNPASKALPIRR
jgi:sugar lactone lactonase YvrE